jgi:hypothetical protein
MGEPLFDQLVTRVEESTADPLERVGAAVGLRETVAADIDRVMDRFVGRAREQGLSWTVIGDRLGVSRQAARQRFADRVQTGFSLQLRPRLRSCLAQAEREARADGRTRIETDHLLAGLLAEGVAAAILENLGLTADKIRAAGHRLFGPPETPLDQTPDMSAEARCALDNAAHIVRNNNPDPSQEFVGTEHLLAALVLDPGSRARRILNDLDVEAAVIKRELSCYVTLNPRRARRRGRKYRGVDRCSFCGRSSTEAGELVAGPGVWICAACVNLATEILEGPTAATTA